MLAAIGVDSVADLFAHIPAPLRLQEPLDLPAGATEAEVSRRMGELAARNRTTLEGPSFLGGGAYLHHIPAVVDSLGSRSEFVTAYTPYQAEASQGTLQSIFEYQSAICELTGMEVSNACLYDGASAAAEAACMMQAARKRKKGRNRLVLSAALDPFAVRTIGTYLANLDVEIVTAPLDEGGRTDLSGLVDEETFGVILATPNFFGLIEEVGPAAKQAHGAGAMLAICTRPMPLGILASPGEEGADIVCGDGGGLGCRPWFGGPSFGFFAGRMAQIRQMPGRIAGATTDRQGKTTYVLTFQPREQHIRREKATSNICTNHALMALRGLIHLVALGRQGLADTAAVCLDLAHLAAEKCNTLEGYSLRYDGPFFNEFVLRCPRPAAAVVAACREAGVQAGIDLGRLFPGRERELMVAVTEANTTTDIEALVKALGGAA